MFLPIAGWGASFLLLESTGKGGVFPVADLISDCLQGFICPGQQQLGLTNPNLQQGFRKSSAGVFFNQPTQIFFREEIFMRQRFQGDCIKVFLDIMQDPDDGKAIRQMQGLCFHFAAEHQITHKLLENACGEIAENSRQKIAFLA